MEVQDKNPGQPPSPPNKALKLGLSLFDLELRIEEYGDFNQKAGDFDGAAFSRHSRGISQNS